MKAFIPFFGLVIRPLEIKLTFKAYRNFLNEKLIFKSAQPGVWQNKSQKEIFLASIGPETDSYLGALIYVSLDVFSYVLSLVFGVLVLGLTLDETLVPAFLLSGILSFISYIFLQSQVKGANKGEQEGRPDFSSFLLMSWNSIFFKNESVITRYKKAFDEKFKNSQDKSLLSIKWSEGLVVVLSTASALPVVAALFWVVQKNQLNSGVLVALLAPIPRQLNLLSTFRSIFQSMASFISFESKFQTLSKNADLSPESLINRISIEDIFVDGKTQKSLHDLVSFIESKKRGRVELRGKNGSGKSSLLLHLNDKLSDSFYLPAHPQMLLDISEERESTGQSLLRHMNYILVSKEKYILLDEWDANLDYENIHQINELLEKLSHEKVVIEVRHRGK